MPAPTDLNVDDITKVASVLRKAAEEYYKSAGELIREAGGDKFAGKPWILVARELIKTADDLDERF